MPLQEIKGLNNVTGETSMRKPKLQDREALETLNPPRTPSRSSSDAREKNEK